MAGCLGRLGALSLGLRLAPRPPRPWVHVRLPVSRSHSAAATGQWNQWTQRAAPGLALGVVACAVVREHRRWREGATLLCQGCAVSLGWWPARVAACEARPTGAAPLELRRGAGGKAGDDYPFDWALFWELIRPDIWTLLAAVVAAFGAAYVNVRIPQAIGAIVNILASKPAMSALRAAAIRTFGLYVAQAGLTFSYISLLSRVGERLCERLRNRLYTSILTQDIGFFDRRKSGDIVNRLTQDVQEFKSSFKQIVSMGLRNLTQVVGGVVSMWLVSRSLTMVLVTVVPVIIGCGTALGSGLRGMSRDAQRATSEATSIASEVIGNIRTVRAFAMEEEEKAHFEKQTAECRRLSINLGTGIGAFSGLSNLFVNSIVLGVLYGGGAMMAQERLSAGELMGFLVSAQTIQRSIGHMSVLFGQVVKGLGAGARAMEFTRLPVDISTTGGLELEAVAGRIQLQGVEFVYPSRADRKVLKGIDLDVQAGSVVALCGQSGGGKSTIASLLERFYDPTQGAILLDGTDLREVDPTWLRRHVLGYISQEPVLFATSVLENIRYGRPSATDAEVVEAARKANAHGFITGFAAGYDTVLGERGVTVSGGQRQRLAIARALLKDPKILLLDEATSALDAESEHLVQEALNELQRGRTVIVIAHRLSTIQNADVIAVVHDGQIVEMGSHEELLRRAGAYARLVSHQLG